MKPIPRLASSGIIDRDSWNNKLAPTIDANFREVTLQPGKGYNIIRAAGGIALDIKPGTGSPAPAAETLRPLQIILSSVTASGTTTNYLSLYPGTVGGVFPKVDSQFLWAMPSDGSGGFLEYPRMAYTPPIEGTHLRVWLKVQCVAGAVVSAVCETGVFSLTPTDPPADPVPPLNSVEFAYVLLGYIRPDGVVVQTTYGNLNYLLAYALFGDGDAGNPFSHNFTPAP